MHGDIGKLVEFGQWLNGDGFHVWEHAFVLLPGNLILEAEPGGARVVPLHYTDVYWCEGIYTLLPEVTDEELLRVGTSLKGTPYSFLDYFELFAHRLHLWAPGLKRAIKTSAHEICSQLADDFYYRLGAHVFTDNRWPGYVTPASLYNRDVALAARQGHQLSWPHECLHA